MDGGRYKENLNYDKMQNIFSCNTIKCMFCHAGIRYIACAYLRIPYMAMTGGVLGCAVGN